MRARRWRYMIPLRLRSLFRPAAADRELDDELRDHLDRKTEHYVAQGMAEPEARRAARLEMGGIEQTKERCRDARRVNVIHDFVQDLRHGLRLLRRSPGFTAVAVLTLALGIGATAAIFTVVDAVLLRSVTYPAADRLVLILGAPVDRPDALSSISYRDFLVYRDRNHVFSQMAGNAFHDLTVTGAGEPFIVNTAAVTPELFPVLGVTPLAGRTLVPDDGKEGAPAVAVVSENLWRSRYGSNRALIGQSITLDMRSFAVVGILPASFRYPDGAAPQDVWIPVAQDPLFGPLMSRPATRLVAGIGRLADGVSLAQARAQVTAIAAELAEQYPAEDSGLTIRLQPYRQAVVANVEPALLILLAAVALVLLIACANLANLLLSRAASRAKEIAVRVAIGARRARIVRQLLAESALLALLGGLAGAFLAVGIVRILVPLLPPEVTRINSIPIGWPVLGFAMLLCCGAALASGLAPALLAAPTGLRTRLDEAGVSTTDRRGGRMRSGLAIAELSLATMLAIAGGLLIRSLMLVTAVNPGFDANAVVEAEVSLPRYEYSTPAQWSAFAHDLLERLHAQPGLQESALGGPLPMDRQGAATFPFSIVGDAPLPPGQAPLADYATVSPDYFRVMRIPLVKGRGFSDDDSAAHASVAIVSETLARRYFPGQDPVGRQMRFGFPPHGDTAREIVGVVGDVRDVALSREPGPMMYVPFAQAPLWGGEVVVRSALDASNVAAGIRGAVRAIDPNLPVTDIDRITDVLAQSVVPARFGAVVLGSFGAVALTLAALGVFGVISYQVSTRTHEFGMRMALGAERRDILRLVMGQGAHLAVWGLSIGAGAALLATRALARLLFGVSTTDPLTFGATALVLLGVTAIACWLPASRATRVDPVVALRHE